MRSAEVRPYTLLPGRTLESLTTSNIKGEPSTSSSSFLPSSTAIYAFQATSVSYASSSITHFLFFRSGIGSEGQAQYGSNSVLGSSEQNHLALRGSQHQLYQHHQYANFNNNNNNSSGGRLSSNGSRSAYTTSNSWSPVAGGGGGGDYLQQQQTSRGFLASSSSSGRNQQQTLSPTGRRENLSSHLDNSRSSVFALLIFGGNG